MKNVISAALFAINIALPNYFNDPKIDILKESDIIRQEYEDRNAELQTIFGSGEIFTKYDVGADGELIALRHYISQENNSNVFLDITIGLVSDGKDWYKIDYIMLPDKNDRRILLHSGVDCLEKRIQQKEPTDECKLHKIDNGKIDQYMLDRIDYINLFVLYRYAFSSDEEIKNERDIETEKYSVESLINHIYAIMDEK